MYKLYELWRVTVLLSFTRPLHAWHHYYSEDHGVCFLCFSETLQDACHCVKSKLCMSTFPQLADKITDVLGSIERKLK